MTFLRTPSADPGLQPGRPRHPGRVRYALVLLVLGAAGASGLAIGGSTCEAEAMNATRRSALAGTWYPANPSELAASIDHHLAHGRPLEEIASARPIALITPHAGHRFSGDAAGAAFRLVAGEAGEDVTRVFLIGPSHHQAFSGASILDVTHYETPLGKVPIDTGVTTALLGHPLVHTVARAHGPEHCLEIELPFLQRVLSHPFRLVPILISGLDTAGWFELAQALAAHVDEHSLIVISSDFCHYGSRFGYQPFEDEPDANLRRLDKGALAPILALDPAALAAYKRETDITVCGLRPIGVLLELLRREAVQAVWGGRAFEGRVLDYYRSADLLGDFDGSVSYASVAFFPRGTLTPGDAYPPMLRDVEAWGRPAAGATEEDGRATAPGIPSATGTGDAGRRDAPSAVGRDETGGRGAARAGEATAAEPPELTFSREEERYLLGLARRTLERVLGGEEPPDPEPYPEGVSPTKMRTVCGVFVTLNKHDHLRGCIGHIVGRERLARGVMDNAVNAALQDPRFPKVTREELDELNIEISVLTPLRRVSGPRDIEVGRHGVVLEREGYRAVFLPQVATEWGWDRTTMLERLSIKAGLPRDGWRRGASFQVFEAIVFGED